MPALTAGMLAVVLAAFLIRLPGLAQPLGIDQGIFATAGWGLLQGLRMYTDLWDQKPPAIHLTYAAGFALLGPHASAVFFMDLLMALLTCGLVGLIARRTMEGTAATAAACVFALLTIPAARYGYGGFLERAVPESFIMPLAAGAALCAARGSPVAGGVAGLLVGAAAVYKPTALVYWPVLLLWLRLCDRPVRRFAVWSAAGLALPGLLAAAWLLRGGSFLDAWIAVVEYNRAYVGTGSGPFMLVDRTAHEVWRWVKTDPLWLLGGVGIAGSFLASARERRLPPPGPLLAACWLAGVVIAAAANGIRLYATYFIPAAAPLALGAGWLIGAAIRHRRPDLIVVTALALAVASGVAWRSRHLPRAWHATAADLRALDAPGDERLQYLERFGGYNTGRGYSARANAELTRYLVRHTGPTDRVYIFGMAPAVYFTARRMPANRFLWTYPGVTSLVDREGFDVTALAHALGAAAPALIVLERNNRDSLTGWRIEQDFESPAMREVLGGYVREGEIEDFVLYRHAAGGPVTPSGDAPATPSAGYGR